MGLQVWSVVVSWPLIVWLSFVFVAMENVWNVLSECGSWIWMWLVMVRWWGLQGKLCSGGVQVCEVVSDLGRAKCLLWC